MPLTRLERERISDSRLKLRSAADSLRHVDPSKVPDFDGIQDCLAGANKNLGAALRDSSQPDSGRK
jgi:hypothetical protein